VSELVERCVAAVCTPAPFFQQEGMSQQLGTLDPASQKIADLDRATVAEIVRRTIAAMREPTGGMLIAARDWSIAKYGQEAGNDGATGCWRLMIDAALK
jgi:hypothetical protein